MAELAAVRAGQRRRATQREEGQAVDVHAEAQVCMPTMPEPVEQAPRRSRETVGGIADPGVALTEGPAPTPSPQPVEQPAKRRRVRLEEVRDPQAPRIRQPTPVSNPTAHDPPTLPNPTAHNPPVGNEPPADNVQPACEQPTTEDTSHAQDEARPQLNRRTRRRLRKALRRWKGLFVEDFPDPLAGAPISEEQAPPPDVPSYLRLCGNLASLWNFDIAELLMTSGMTDAARERHLRSAVYQGQTPWLGCEAMLKDIDKLPHGPDFTIHDIDIFDGERERTQYLVMRDVISVIRELFANPDFRHEFRYRPEKLFTSADKRERMYSEMWSADWWWREQEKLRDEGKGAATIAPLILASDQTTLSVLCGGQTAYPVYLTVGNISKDDRRKPSKHAMVLLGYLPIEAFEDVENDEERRRMKADLVHRSMETMLEPLKVASQEGVEMWCPDGRLRRVYPRVAAYMADWPEQNLMSCTSVGSCPICTTKQAGRGNLTDSAPLRDREETLGAIRNYFLHRSVAELKDLGLKPVWPWWGDIPGVNLATCFAPDPLHQLYQGIFKSHLLRWVKELIGEETLNQRFASMPQAEGMKHFAKGITCVKQWTGRESKQMIQQFLPMVLGDLTPEVSQLVRSIIDFIFRAHSSSLTDTEIDNIQHDLDMFHQLKDILVVRGVYQSSARFDKIPKLHMLSHYTHFIRELGTPDGYNTEAPERLHIEYAKVPWRASNKVKPLPQMITYIQRQEAIRMHRAYLNRHLNLDRAEDDEAGPQEETAEIFEGGEEVEVEAGGRADDTHDDVDGADDAEGDIEGAEDGENAPAPVTYPNPRRHMAKNPTKRNLLVKDVTAQYGASDLTNAITTFLTNRLDIPRHDIVISPHNRLDIWHRLYLHHRPLPFAPFEPPRRDVVRASAPVYGSRGRVYKPGVWDVALYLERPNRLRNRSSDNRDDRHGIQRYRAGRVRAFFKLPGHLRSFYSGHLAFVEVFEPFEASVSPFTRMHSTQPEYDSRGRRRTLVLPVAEIILACHLAPKFNKLDKDLKLNARTDLFAISKHFWLNYYYNSYTYLVQQHWWRCRPTRMQRLRSLVR
ncbi:hypothetical protein FRC08_003275 [Ceratobasidium sp. 394]|nr:hypothetical protein FRC08_003275 [Ceratobasidium sp. 394]